MARRKGKYGRGKYEYPISSYLTEDQYRLFRRKLFSEGLTIQKTVSALINAYIMGDVSVTSQGRYILSPPSGYIPLVEIPEGADVVEIEPDWGRSSERPQIGATDYNRRPRYMRSRWYTREAADHLRRVTGRRISLRVLRNLCNHLELPKASSGQWVFSGPEDGKIKILEEAIYEGVYDDIVRLGTYKAKSLVARRTPIVGEWEETSINIEDLD